MWPAELEPGPSVWPRRLRLAALLLAWAGLFASGLPLSLAALAALAVHAGLRHWRPLTVSGALVSPAALRLTLSDRRRVTLTPPFRALVRPGWLALHCPGRGWVWVFGDQASAADLTPLRQVVFLNRR